MSFARIEARDYTLAKAAARAVAVILAAGALSGCYYTSGALAPPDAVASVPVPNDYRLRHPIAIRDGDRNIVLFIGPHRGSLTPAQRADVVGFARMWHKEATGGMVIDVPSGTSNQRAAREASGEVRALLAAELPANSVVVRNYQPEDRERFAPIRVHYPKIVAEAGPCGLWPHDLGPSHDPEHVLNKPYWNLGCAQQRNLASMVDDPADIVQPRGETPAYEGRRAVALDKYRQGQSSATNYPNTGQGKISDIGQ